MTDVGADSADFAPRLDPDSSRPPFHQITTQIRAAVRDGDLPAGARLPSVRVLARDLGLAANTVAKTYRALEEEGLLEGRGRSGTFVRVHGEDDEELTRAARTYVRAAREIGVTDEIAMHAVRTALEASGSS